MALSTSLSRPIIKYRSPDATETTLFNAGQAFTGRGFSFDGVNDQITIGNPGISCKSICFYVYADTTTEQFIQLTSTEDVQVSAGTITATGWTSPTEYVDGIAGDTIQATTWHFVAVTSATAITVNDMEIGEIAAAFGAFDMSNLKVFDVELTAAQVAELYQNPEQVLPTGIAAANLVGWWPLADAGNSGYILDGSGNNNRGTLSGATAVNGIGAPVTQVGFKGIRTPMYGDGTDDYISVSDDATLDFDITDAFSISVWAQEWSTTDRGIISKFSSDGYYTRFEANGYIRFSIDTSGTSGHLTSASNVITKGKLHHYVFTYDGSSNRSGMNIYFDGAINTAGTATALTGSMLNNSALEIGRHSAGQYHEGIIHKVTIWSNELTAGNVTSLYNSGTPIDDTTIDSANVVSNWINTGNTNADWEDQTGSNDGTVNGSPGVEYIPEGITANKDIIAIPLTDTNINNLIADSGAYIQVPDDSNLDITTNITLEAWVKPFSTSAVQTIIGKDNAYALKIDASAKAVFSRWSTTEGSATSTGVIFTVDTWTHIAITWNNTNCLFYKDGVLDSTVALATVADTSTDDVIIGGLTSTAEMFDGYIDEPKIYNAILDADQILQNYNAQKTAYL